MYYPSRHPLESTHQSSAFRLQDWPEMLAAHAVVVAGAEAGAGAGAEAS